MDAIENILSRRSIRKYQDRPIDGKIIKEIQVAAFISRDFAVLCQT